MTRPTANPAPDTGRPAGRCLTELSAPVLIAGALAVSALLWLAIYAVL